MLVFKEGFDQCLRRSSRPVTLLASTRMVLFVVAELMSSHLLARVFEPGQGIIANFTMRRTRQDRSRALPPTGVY